MKKALTLADYHVTRQNGETYAVESEDRIVAVFASWEAAHAMCAALNLELNSWLQINRPLSVGL